MKVKQIFVLSFWIIAFLSGSITAAHTYSISVNQGLVSDSVHSVKNNQLGTQINFDGVEQVMLYQKKITQDRSPNLILCKNYCRLPSVLIANYNFTHQASIYNAREVLTAKIYPTHSFW